MIEREFFRKLNEELTQRGFFIITDHSPENCINISIINGYEKQIKYVRYIQKNYKLAAVKNFTIIIGNNECVSGFFEILVGSETKEPYPMIFINIEYEKHLYKMAYMCRYVRDFIFDNTGKEATKYIIECIKNMVSELMSIEHEWMVNGKFPTDKFALND